MKTIFLNDTVQIFEKENISGRKRDKRTIALNKTNLTLTHNNIYLFFGPSGSGKTTLMNILSTRHLPTAGIIIFDKENIYEKSNNELQFLRSKIGYLTQNLNENYITQLSPNQIINLIKPRDKIDNRIIINLLSHLKLRSNILDVPFYQLSGGEKQRICFIFH
jgi:ABC-type lipoprotein export system ATPase subunit